ncbi:MAG: recombination-associated protein RdgC [Gammaproteobacteria bacterium]|nr:recombination-associated protein RdgC [Gammaproteobacteria bacterium]
MWFKNLTLYRFTEPFALDPEELEQRLSAQASRPCGKLEMFTYGWVPPLGRIGKTLTHVTNGQIMLCARKEEKLLPASVIREFVDERVAELEEAEHRGLSNYERQGIRDEIIQDLLPKALIRSALTYAYIAPKEGWLIVDAASTRKAEELTALLRDSLGSLSVIPPAIGNRPAQVMTGWLSDGVPEDFEIEDECELRDPEEEGGIVRCRRQDLGSDEIRAHLQAGKQVVKLAVQWDQRLTCILGEDLSIKRLRFTDMVQEEAAEVDVDSAAARFDADFAIMSLELARFLPRLVESFGGEDRQLSTGKAA